MLDNPINLTRKRLYEKIWTEPIARLAPQLGLSDRGLAKLCERHRIPRPGRGYWQKKKFGKKVRRTPLPRLRKGEGSLAEIRIRPKASLKKPDRPTGPVEERQALEKRPENKIEVPERVGRYHPLIRQTRDVLKGWGSPRIGWNNRYRALPAGCLDVRVEKASRRRALKIMDALIKALEDRGFEVRVSHDDKNPKTLVSVHEIEFPVQIEEEYRRIELPPDEDELERKRRYGWEPRKRYEYEGTGDLVLKINAGRWPRLGSRKTWADGKKQRVEELLNSFVVGLVRAAEVKKAWNRKREEEQRRREEERRLAEIQRRRLEQEQARRKELRRQAVAWDEHRQMMAYVAALRVRAEKQGVMKISGPVREWIEWAERYLETADPLIRLDQPLSPPDQNGVVRPGVR